MIARRSPERPWRLIRETFSWASRTTCVVGTYATERSALRAKVAAEVASGPPGICTPQGGNYHRFRVEHRGHSSAT